MVHADILFEALLFSTRDTLDAVQLASQALQDTVGQSSTLPLRYIGYAWLSECGGCFINALTDGHTVLDEEGWYDAPNYDVTLATEAGNRDYMRRLNNAFIEELVVCFACGTFLQYLREHSDEFFCRLSVLTPICDNHNNEGAIQYDLVAFIAQKFEPQAYEPKLEWGFGIHAQYVTLFDHESLRHSIELLDLSCPSVEVPTSVVPALFNVRKLKTCHIRCADSPNKWVSEFIDTFEQAVDAARIVASVTIVRIELYGDAYAWYPTGVHGRSRLVHPEQTDLSPPRTAFLDKLLADGLFCGKEAQRTQSKCELYVFTNAALVKRLHVYTWRIDEEETWDGGASHHELSHEVTHIILIDM